MQRRKRDFCPTVDALEGRRLADGAGAVVAYQTSPLVVPAPMPAVMPGDEVNPADTTTWFGPGVPPEVAYPWGPDAVDPTGPEWGVGGAEATWTPYTTPTTTD